MHSPLTSLGDEGISIESIPLWPAIGMPRSHIVPQSCQSKPFSGLSMLVLFTIADKMPAAFNAQSPYIDSIQTSE